MSPLAFWRSLRGQIVLAFSVIAILLGMGVGAAVHHFARTGIEAQVELSLNTVAAGVRSRLDLSIGSLTGQLQRTIERDRLLGQANRQARLDILQNSQPEYLWIGFVDAHGIVTHATDGERVGKRVSGERWFKAAQDPAFASAMEAADPLQKDFGIVLPSDPDQRIAGSVLAAQISTQLVDNMLRDARQTHFRAKGLDLQVFDRSGRLIAATGKTEQRPPEAELLRATGADFAGWSRWQDGLHLAAFHSMHGGPQQGGPRWVIVARQDEASARAPARELLTNVVTVAIVVVLISLLAAWWLGGMLARPVVRAAEAAERIRDGDREVRFPIMKRFDESRRLGVALAGMVDKLIENERTLRTTNIRLEEAVTERTRELTDASRKLQVERQRLSLSLAGSRIAAWDADVTAGDVWLSAEWAEMLGDPAGEATLKYKELITLVPEEDRQRVWRLQRAALRGELPFYDVEHMVKRQDGSWFWVRSRGTVVARDHQGRALRMAGTNSDVTRRKQAENEIRYSEQKLRLVADNLPFMINFLDRDCRLLLVNRLYLEFLGFEGQDLTGKSLKDVAGEEAWLNAKAGIPRLEAGEFVRYERERKDRHGRVRHMEIMQIPHFGLDGKLAGFFSIIDDCTERKEAERLVAAREAQLSLITRHVPVGICEADLEGNVVFANPHYHLLYQRPEGSLIGTSIFELVDAESRESLLSRRDALLAGQAVEYERTVTLPGKGPADLNVHLVPRLGAGGKVASVYALVSDVTARNQVRDMLRAQALTDSLTGLPNRRLLLDRLEQGIAHARRHGASLAVMYLDIDGFKPINDRHGHASGDELLREIARRLRTAVRESDTVSRLGGDEFVVVLDPCDSPEVAATVAEKLISTLREPVRLQMTDVEVGASVGIAIFPADAEDAVSLLECADKALYRAKAAGKGRHTRVVG